MLMELDKNNKIINFEDITEIISANSHLRIVQSHGVFDLLHIGHIRHFQLAKSHGDILIVTITSDRYVNKGPHRPYFTENLRAEAIAALDCVDYVIINDWPTAVEAIKTIKPRVYVKGIEYQDIANDITGKINEEIHAVETIGGRIVYTEDITFSSSTLINQFFSPFSREVNDYLSHFKTQYNTNLIFDYLKRAKNLQLLVIGEAIIDIYHFSEVLGKAGKEPTLVAKQKSIETYLGGSLAIANHLSDFCRGVTCLTYLGEHGEYENIIRAGLKSNVNLIPIYKKNSPTIVKRRYVEHYLHQKLFETYEINDDFFTEEQQTAFIEQLKPLLTNHDLTIVADFGHGLLNVNAIEEITQGAKFLAVNTQSNAGNHGFNFISKYPKADYISITTRELELNYRQRHLSVMEQLNRFIKEINCKNVMITYGKKGSYTYKQNEPICKAPAFASHVIDRVGAGDAVLAITSLFAYLNAPAELIAFIGNVVGAEAVGIMGNKCFIEKIPLMKHIAHLLK
jgi:rfaE bifunctional protein nucleotidyltransferase chain/domain